MHLAATVDGLAAVVSVMVAVVALLVQVYSIEYLRGDPRYPTYAAFVSLFTAAMLLVVVAGDLVVLLVGWEVMGLCSYLLIGHHRELPERRAAALKAFLMTRLGDVGFLVGVIVLGWAARVVPDRRRARRRPARCPPRRCSPPGCCSPRRGRQVGAVPAARLAAGRDGRSRRRSPR